jgi:hypothetical protein
MPSLEKTIGAEERWRLAHYVESLQVDASRLEETTLKARRSRGRVPAEPGDPAWQECESLGVALTGQVLAAPRWQNFSVDYVEVRALYDDERLALRLAWNDNTRSVEHSDQVAERLSKAAGTYPELDSKGPPAGPLRDSVAVEFPQQAAEGPAKPHFFLGDKGNPVNLWRWKADSAKVEEETASGLETSPAPQPEASQLVTSSAAYADGQWSLVLVRKLKTGQADDAQFEPGMAVPVAFMIWDGGNEEAGRRHSLSSWMSLVLELPTPLKVYFYPLLSGLCVAGLEVLLLLGVGRNKGRQRS